MPVTNPYILYSRQTCVTGRALREGLGISGGRTLNKIGSYDLLIRWGASHSSYLDIEFKGRGGVLNPHRLISAIANREHMFRLLMNTGAPDEVRLNFYRGVSPITPNLRPRSGVDQVTLLRHRFGRWGKDIIRAAHADSALWADLRRRYGMEDSGYFSVEEWLADHEVRLHIFDGRCILAQIKALRPGTDFPACREPIIRNTKNGWGLYPLSTANAREMDINKGSLRGCAKRVIAHVGLKFGVVDFLVRTSPFSYKMLEINTAPGLDGSSLTKYCDKFRSLLTSTDPVPDEDEEDDWNSDEVEEVPLPPMSSGLEEVAPGLTSQLEESTVRMSTTPGSRSFLTNATSPARINDLARFARLGVFHIGGADPTVSSRPTTNPTLFDRDDTGEAP